MPFRVLVTGCSSGIGRALALELTSRGHHVIATARNRASITGIGAEQLTLDVCSDASVTAAAAVTGPVDVLVNNAGVGLWAPIEAIPIELAKALFETNFFGAIRTQNAFLPGMRARRRGQIIQISSAVGRISNPLVGHYSASKHALEAMSQALRAELAVFGVKVAIVELGAVESNFAPNRLAVSVIADYQPVIDHVTHQLQALRTRAVSSTACARTIADVIESGAPDLMVEGTADVATLIAARRAQSDAQWEQELVGQIRL